MKKNDEKPKLDKVRMTVGVGVVVILTLIILMQNFSDNELTLWQTEEDIGLARSELHAAQKELRKKLNVVEMSRVKQEAFTKKGKDYWIEKRDGKIEVSIQRLI
mgnify:CR=1 FL=1